MGDALAGFRNRVRVRVPAAEDRREATLVPL